MLDAAAGVVLGAAETPAVAEYGEVCGATALVPAVAVGGVYEVGGVEGNIEP